MRLSPRLVCDVSLDGRRGALHAVALQHDGHIADTGSGRHILDLFPDKSLGLGNQDSRRSPLVGFADRGALLRGRSDGPNVDLQQLSNGRFGNTGFG